MIDTSKIQTGDVMFLRVRWNPWNIKTYLSRLINFGVNFWDGIWNFFLGKQYQYCPANHCGIFYRDHKGQLYIYEANEKGFVGEIALVRLHDISEDNIWVKRFDNLERVEHNISKMIGVKYDYGFLVREFGNLLTDKKFQKSKLHTFKEGVCSNIVAKILNDSNPVLCVDSYNYTPKDVWIEKGGEFITEIYKK